MTIRECIDKMRKVGSMTIYLSNGTKIMLIEMNAPKYDEIGTFKRNADGSIRVIRRILCSIKSAPGTQGIEELKKQGYWMYDPESEYNYFNNMDFLLPERIMNSFIASNGGIDEYRTISEPYYMLLDSELMLD